MKAFTSKFLVLVLLSGFLISAQPADAATYASGALAFNATGTGCPTSTPEGGYLSISPGVVPSGNDTFTVQAVIRSRDISIQNAVVLIGAQTSSRALSIRNLSNNSWSIDLAGDSRMKFVMASGQMQNNTWYQLTIVGDSSGIGFWIDGVRLRSNIADLDWAYTALGAPGASNKLMQMSASPDIFKFFTPINASSAAVGAWTNNGWCSGGFDLSNLRFNTQGLFASNATTVTFPDTPLGNISGTSLLINSTSASEAITTTDASGIQTINNRTLLVTATVDTNTPAIAVTTPANQTIAPGEAVSCSVGSSGGTITRFALAPAASNGLSFDTATGLLSGVPTAASAPVTYVITGYNNSGSVTTSCTITVSAPAVQVSVPAPLQQSEISSLSPEVTFLQEKIALTVLGKFVENIVNIALDGILLSPTTWFHDKNEIHVTGANLKLGNHDLQIYNGSFPLLKTLSFSVIEKPQPLPTATPTPEVTVTPAPTPTSSAVTSKHWVKIASIYFASGSYSLSPKAIGDIDKTIPVLQSLENPHFRILGHTDLKGGTINTLLSRRRAEAVSEKMVGEPGLSNLAISWFASRKPASRGLSQASLALNRRVEIWVYKSYETVISPHA